MVFRHYVLLIGGTIAGVIGLYVQQYVPGGAIPAGWFYVLCAVAFVGALFASWRDEFDRAEAADGALAAMKNAMPDATAHAVNGSYGSAFAVTSRVSVSRSRRAGVLSVRHLFANFGLFPEVRGAGLGFDVPASSAAAMARSVGRSRSDV